MQPPQDEQPKRPPKIVSGLGGVTTFYKSVFLLSNRFMNIFFGLMKCMFFLCV